MKEKYCIDCGRKIIRPDRSKTGLCKSCCQKGKRNHNYGKRASETTKKILSNLRKGNKHWNYGKHWSDNIKRKISEKEMGKKDSVIVKIKKSIARKGNGSSTWKDGRTPDTNRIRSSAKYSEWRQKIFIRDEFTCQICGKKGGYLTAHHSEKSFSQLLDEVLFNLPLLSLYDGAMIYEPFWNIKNGITHCSDCHGKWHKKYGKKYRRTL